MQPTSLRAYQIFLGFVSILYAGVIVLSVSGLLIGVVSASVIQHQDQQFRNQMMIFFVAFASLPVMCAFAIVGSWMLFFFRRYLLAPLPLLLPFISVAIISLIAGDDISGVMGWK